MSVKLTIHSTGTGQCCLTGKEGDGMTVTFEDGTVAGKFLSWKAFQQVLRMKTGAGTPEAKPEPPAAKPVQAQPAGNSVAAK